MVSLLSVSGVMRDGILTTYVLKPRISEQWRCYEDLYIGMTLSVRRFLIRPAKSRHCKGGGGWGFKKSRVAAFIG